MRNRKGKLPLDVAKDERVKSLLKGVLAQSSFTTLVQSPQQPATNAPKLTGTLSKWTNFASGYKKRYVVLQDGQVSYYRN